ncbi:MAG TPA: DUF2505 family protein [Acidimicrobiales bacterium]|nr:DUF2505 family protein [Acidimicrobiales bacterium]
MTRSAVRFHGEHRFHGSVSSVSAILADPAFYLELDLPDLGRPELLEHRAEGHETVVRLRYEFVGSLDPIAQRLIGSSRLVWVQEVRVDRSAGSGALRFEAEKSPRQLYGTADFVLTPGEGDSVRTLDGELVVAVPGIGRMAERRIVPGLVRRLDIEAEALNAQLEQER